MKKIKVGFIVRHDLQEGRGHFDIVENEITAYYPHFGIIPIIISSGLKDPIAFIEDTGVEAIIISGGNGVSPELFDESKTADNRWSNIREQMNIQILKYVLEKNIPYLGICTGFYQLNVYLGGKILQDIQAHSTVDHSRAVHNVSFVNDQAREYFGKDTVVVNSYHKQAIDQDMLSTKLKAFAICEADNTIEAAYYPGRSIAAVTWHPERLGFTDNKAFNEKLIKAFVNRELFWKTI